MAPEIDHLEENGLPDSSEGNKDDISGDVASVKVNGEKKSREAEKRRRRRDKKKLLKAATKPVKEEDEGTKTTDTEGIEDVEVVYVSAKPEDISEEFLKVFEKFTTAESLFATANKEEEKEADTGDGTAEEPKTTADKDSDESDEDENRGKGVSNKERKLRRRMKVAELKQICPRPEVVEIWDATAADPKLLVYLKAYRNTVPVPRHWSQKRKFLQGKRGIEKQPFQLPDFVAATGIEKLRQAYIEKEDTKKLKAKQREKMQPKMGKMDIDYQVLHDAFFKYQTKPKLTQHGDLYHEGKEFEAKVRDYKPGQLSDELKEALGMVPAGPPTWLINMQRYGPPPSYPHLKIPGLNAPIPEGALFGYHPGGWGKPPVDETGKPLYGDVFGTSAKGQDGFEDEPVDRSKRWGDLEEEEEEEEEEEAEEEDEDDELKDVDHEGGIASVDTISTTPAGVETPDVIDLRKAQRKEPEKNLYTVLGQQEEHVGPNALMGASHTYVIPTADKAAPKKVDIVKGQKADKVDITLRPEELEGLDDAALAQKYEQARDAEKAPGREDFSDMVAEMEKKRKRKAQDKDVKKPKQDFKF